MTHYCNRGFRTGWQATWWTGREHYLVRIREVRRCMGHTGRSGHCWAYYMPVEVIRQLEGPTEPYLSGTGRRCPPWPAETVRWASVARLKPRIRADLHLVQKVLDRALTGCHHPGGGDPMAATAGHGPAPDLKFDEGNWYWSTDDERYSAENGPFPTRDEALEAGRAQTLEEEGVPCRIWTGQREDYFPMLNVEYDVLETLGERADDEAGDCADGWPSMTDEAKAAFQEELDALIKKHVPEPTWFIIRKTESHEPKEEASV